jgi:hypothetical protein
LPAPTRPYQSHFVSPGPSAAGPNEMNRAKEGTADLIGMDCKAGRQRIRALEVKHLRRKRPWMGCGAPDRGSQCNAYTVSVGE